MKVILKSKMKKLGNIGDVVEVKDGYARNMLIPNGLALFYTDQNYEYFKQKKAEIEKENQEKKVKAEELQAKILSKDIILIENAGDDGKLYGSITTSKLAKAINSALKIDNLNKNNIYLKEPIRNIGKYDIIVELHTEVSFDKDVIVSRTKEEAIKIKKGEFKLEKKETDTEITTDVEADAIKEEKKVKKSKKKEEDNEKSKEVKETSENKEEAK